MTIDRYYMGGAHALSSSSIIVEGAYYNCPCGSDFHVMVRDDLKRLNALVTDHPGAASVVVSW